MGQSLNNCIVAAVAFLIFSSGQLMGQAATTANSKSDYKDPKGHEKFQKRRAVVGAWQVNQLKVGALIVRLKTNQLLIDGLRKAGKTEEAEMKEAEQYLINKYIVRAWLDKYNFSKVLFIYSSSSDSLTKGRTSGIFLDSTLNVDPNIALPDKFYLFAERDYVYNSSIGFVPEDSARTTVEAGNPTREMAIVVKNKYNHQLKAPFPYYVQSKSYSDATVANPVKITYKGKHYAVPIAKQLTYEKYAPYVQQFNERILKFYRNSASPEQMDYYEQSRPYFY